MISKKTAVILLALLLIGGALAYSLMNVQPGGEKLVLYNNFAYYEQNLKLSGTDAQFALPDGIERDSVNLRIVNGYVVSQHINEANITNDAQLLKSYVGKEVSVFDDKGKEIKGTLLKFDGKAYVKAGTDLFIITPSYYQLPGFSGNISDQNASVSFRINASQQSDARLSYLLDSLSWAPDYTLYLAGDRGSLSLYGAVSNSAKDYDNISLSLFYGQVKRTSRGYYYPTYDFAKGMENSINTASGGAPAPSYTPSAVSEFYKFDLGNVALPKGDSKFNLFERQVNEVKKTYEMSVSSYGSSTDPQPLAIMLAINNSVANGLGVALPAGNVRIMDDTGFVGEDTASDTTKGEELKISQGNAFDVVGTSRLVNQTSDTIVSCAPSRMAAADAPLCVQEDGDIYVATYTYDATVKNKKDASANVVLNYNPYGEWAIMNETMPHEKVSQNLVKWRFALGSNTEKTLSFIIKVKTGRVIPKYYYNGVVPEPGTTP
ncbi:Uncharacterised protein [uncultured archaeon]|nr:Uncharacterised protein [uncultured archaeon]